jgi:UDP-perosamine 4-acetyltransferase
MIWQMPEPPIVIIGTGDHARVVLDLLAALGREPIGLIEAGDTAWRGRSVEGREVIGNLLDDAEWSESGPAFTVAVGDNQRRSEAFHRCLELGCDPIALIHPTAILLGGAVVEPGAQVCASAIVGVATTVSRNAIVNTAALLDHDNVIADHAFVAPGAHLAGRVMVGEGAHVGIGASVVQGVTIGAWAVVAAGAVVVSDVEPSTRVAGVPARLMDAQNLRGT